jgi:hypothetical protein
VLDGQGSADTLTGNAGNDTFAFIIGQANGDAVVDFAGNGAGLGDSLKFVGYGEGATFTNIDATHWQVNYNSGARRPLARAGPRRVRRCSPSHDGDARRPSCRRWGSSARAGERSSRALPPFRHRQFPFVVQRCKRGYFVGKSVEDARAPGAFQADDCLAGRSTSWETARKPLTYNARFERQLEKKMQWLKG